MFIVDVFAHCCCVDSVAFRSRPDITAQVDWAQNTSLLTYLLTYLLPSVASILPSDVTFSSCDFEGQGGSGDVYCGFTTNRSAGFSLGSGRVSSMTGPMEDHTLGSPHGRYGHTRLHQLSGRFDISLLPACLATGSWTPLSCLHAYVLQVWAKIMYL